MKSVMLFVEDRDKNEAQFMSANFVDENIRNRVYLNAIGSELVMRYLSLEGIETSNLHNLHSISKIIEVTDISDILLPNIHIDVRVIFDEKQIFIPISHHELGIEPDVYVVLKLDKSFEKFNMIGFFTPDKINKKNKNSQYYFVNRAELLNPEKFAQFVQDYSAKPKKEISDAEFLRGRSLSVSLADHDLEFDEKKELFALLLSSDKLRESVLEFDNFETLSYNVASTVEDLNVIDVLTEQDENKEELLKDDSQESSEQQQGFSENEDNQEEEILPLEDNLELSSEDSLPDLDISVDDFQDMTETAADVAEETVQEAISDEISVSDAATKGTKDLAALAGELADSLPDVSVGEEDLQDFSDVKSELEINNDEYAINDEYDSPKDLSDFEQINESVEQDFEQVEPIDFSGLETIETEPINDEDDMEHLTDFDSAPIDDFNNIDLNDEDEQDFSENVTGEMEQLPQEEPDMVEDEINSQIENNIGEIDDIEMNISNEEQDINLKDEGFSEQEMQDEVYEESGDENSVEIEETSKDESEDWISDVDFGDFDDSESEQPKDVENEDSNEFVDEELEYKEPQVIENSIVISDKNFEVGEIEIDINKPEEQFLDGSEHLKNIYEEKDSMPGGSLLNSPGLLNISSKTVGLGIVGIITSLIVVGILGISLSKMLKKPSEEVPQPITDTNTTSAPSNPEALNVNEGNVINMDKTSPIAPSAVQHKTDASSQVQAPAANKQLSPTQFIEVSKLSWEAPDYVAANQSFRQYFQSAGKSLKLSLTSDLLLANEYIYSDQARVSINFGQDGSLKDARILLSSGSQQVDKIVLQTVNQTLNVLKAPRSIGNNSGTTVILKIYF